MRRGNPRFRIRRATLGDLETLVEHRHKMFEDIGLGTEEEHAAGDRIYREWAEKMMRQGLALFFVASDGKGRIVASGGVWLRERQPRLSDRGGPAPYLLAMYTAPEYRRRGLATSIVRKAEEWSRKEGYSSMTLHASRMGRKLYAEMGWKRGWEMYKELDDGAAKKKRVSTPKRGPGR